MIALLNRLYRLLFCRGGFGIHSPFVFDLITNVIEERKLYYCYERLNPVRLQIVQRCDEVIYSNSKVSIRKLLKKNAFTEHEHKFLFRLANHFQPKSIFTLGSDFGLTPLYLTAYSTNADCVVVEPEASMATLAKEYINIYATASIDLRNDYGEIPDRLDFVVLGFGAYPVKKGAVKTDVVQPSGKNFDIQTFERFLPFIHEKSVMVIAGINASKQARKDWKAVYTHPEVTVTIDLLRLGVVFFNPALHHRNYKSIVL